MKQMYVCSQRSEIWNGLASHMLKTKYSTFANSNVTVNCESRDKYVSVGLCQCESMLYYQISWSTQSFPPQCVDIEPYCCSAMRFVETCDVPQVRVDKSCHTGVLESRFYTNIRDRRTFCTLTVEGSTSRPYGSITKLMVLGWLVTQKIAI